MKYVIYTRLSKESKDENKRTSINDKGEGVSLELSLEIQKKECIAYCKNKPYVVFEDKGKSGGLPLEKRLNLLEAIACLERGDVLLSSKPDRLARSEEIATIKYLVRQKEAKLEYVDGTKVDSQDIQSIMVECMKNMFATYEKFQISSRTKKALKERKDRNERYGSLPYGFTVAEDGIRLTMDEREQEILSMMITLFNQGVSIRRIPTELANLGMMNRKGNPFQHMTIWKILKRLGKSRCLDQPLEELALQ